MPTTKLTKRNVDGIAPDGKRSIWYDTELKGFGLKVEPTGTMSWIVEYRPGAGGRGTTKRRMTLGKLGVLAPDEARIIAKDVLARVHAGGDPASEKSAAKLAMKIAELCDRYVVEAEMGNVISRRGVPKKASTLATDRGRIERHIKPLLGRKAVRDLNKSDIERFLRDVAGGKTAVDVKTKKHGRAIVTGGRGTATRTVRLLGGILSYAIRLGLRDDNPTHGVAKYADQQGGRFLSTAELERLGEALRDAETIGLPWDIKADKAGAKHLPKSEAGRRAILGPHVTAAIRLLILTGCRLREILHLKWDYVDLERGLLNLPDSKTGAKVVVLGAPALKIIASVPRVEGNPYVIAGKKADRPRSDLKRPWAIVKRVSGLEGVRIHDLRHTFASYGAAAGMGLTIVGRLLGHADVKTTNRYSHFDADPLRRAANTVGTSLSSAMAGPSTEQDNIVNLPTITRNQ